MKKLTPKQRVLRKYPRAGLELSAMYGWRVMDYTNPEDRSSPALSVGRKTEAAAWADAARKL